MASMCAIQSRDEPIVWLLLGDKNGDNAQVLSLGKALGWRSIVKQLHYIEGYPVSYRKRGASLAGLDLDRSTPIEGPWPDIVIGIGQRSAPVARWIKDQSKGRTLNIRLGRPRIDLKHFDLVVSTLQYGLARTKDSMLLTLPFTTFESETVSLEKARWLPSLSHLPRPWTAILIGGKNNRLRLDAGVIRQMLTAMSRYHDVYGGSFLLTTSPRTPAAATRQLRQLIDSEWRDIPAFLYEWTPHSANPYIAMLASADQVVVTNDTVSMVADAAVCGKALSVYALPPKAPSKKSKILRPLVRSFCNWQANRQESGIPPSPLDKLYQYLTNRGVIRPPRNIPVVFRHLFRLGAVRPFQGHPNDRTGAGTMLSREREQVVQRIQKMLAAKRGVSVDSLIAYARARRCDEAA
jgi:mitochondrial fission protein ELM1